MKLQFGDYKEPEVAYYIDSQGDVFVFGDTESDDWTKEEAIGNYFETKEEAEKAVEKLKAWKRLRDKGFRFEGWDSNHGHFRTSFKFAPGDNRCLPEEDLDLLFGGEE